MALIYNGNSPEHIIYNGNNVSEVYYNGVKVWPLGVIVELTGISPLTLLNALAANLESLTLYGKCGYTDSSLSPLPEEYTRLEYIESTGTQYINTGIIATADTGIKIEYEYTATGSAAIAGIYQGTTPRTDTLFISTGSGNVSNTTFPFCAQLGQTYYTANNVALNTKYTCFINYLNSGYMGFDDTVSTAIGTNTPEQYAIPIFARYSVSGDSYSISNSRIYDVVFTEGNAVSHHLIPAKRLSDNELGMYDTVTNTFFTNAGTGTFVAGGNIEYTRVGHITFGGSQFVNTGILPSAGLKIKVVFTGIGYNNTIIGGNTSSSNRFQVYSASSTKTFYIRLFQSTTQTSYASVDYDSRHTLIIDLPNSTASLDGNEKSISFTEQTSTVPIGLGATINTSGTTAFAFLSSDVEQFTVWDNGTLVANYIPCKNSSDVYGFYDTVSETFKGDSANVGFTGGGEIVPSPEQIAQILCNNGEIKLRNTSGLPLGYRRCDYIKSNDKIDLGIHTNQDTIILCYYNRTGTSTAQYLYLSDSNSSGSTNTTAYVSGSNGNWRFDGRAQSINTPTGKHRSEQRKTGVWIDNSREAIYSDVSNFTSTNTLSAFSSISSDGVLWIDRIQVRDYNGQIGVYDYDWVACQRYDGAYGFYDIKNDTFHTNPNATVTGGDITDSYEYYIDGTTETIEITGKNLLYNPSYLRGYINDSGVLVGATTPNQPSITLDYFPVKPNTTYTFSYKTSRQSYYDRVAGYSDTDEASFTQLYVKQDNRSVDIGSTISFTFTTDSTTKYIRVFCACAEYTDGAINWQLEYGSTATTYEAPFNGGTATAENLMAASTYKDEQEVISGIVTRAVGVKILDGTEDWNASTPTGVYGLGLSGTVRIDSRIAIPCTHYSPTNETNSDMPDCSIKTSFSTVSGMSDKVCIFIKDNRFATVNDFKAYLAGQASAGTPVIAVYPLGTTTTETVTGQTLSTTDGTNILEITQASLDGLEMNVEYYATEAPNLGRSVNSTKLASRTIGPNSVRTVIIEPTVKIDVIERPRDLEEEDFDIDDWTMEEKELSEIKDSEDIGVLSKDILLDDEESAGDIAPENEKR